MQQHVERLRAEFLEMPGLRLTREQIRRFCGLEAAACSAALEVLVKEQFLSARPDGTFGRSSEGELVRLRPAKASLTTKSSGAIRAAS